MPRRRRTEKQKSELRPTLDRFADDTSMLGFRYLHTRYKNWFRLVWALVLIFFVGLTVYQVCERITYYFIRNPLSTRRSYDTPQHMRFPTIGICNKMQLKASAIAARDPELVRAMCLAHTYDGQVTTNRSIIDSLSSFDHIDLLEVHKNAHQKVEDLFLSCEFGKTGSCQDDIHPILTPHGLCFAVSPNMTVRRPGPEATLSLLLNLEIYEIIPGTVVDPGVILSIYDKNDALSQQFTEGIHLEAGKVVTIPINEVRKLSRFHHYCGRRIAGPFSKDEYSLAACQWANIMDEIEKKCKCRPVNSPHNRIFIAGHKESYMLNVKDKPRRQVRTCTLRQELNCVHNYTLIEDINISNLCPEDCEDVSFSSVVFGGKLVPFEISSLLPSDWEDQKEARMTNFQKALDVIPNYRIPVVRSVQTLAQGAQNFLDLAQEIFDIHKDFANIPCISSKGIRTLERSFNQLKSYEAIWERLTTYLKRSFSREINSTAAAIGLRLTNDASLAKFVSFKYNYSVIALSLLQLGLMERQLAQPQGIFGLRLMDTATKQSIIDFVLPFIQKMRQCIIELHDKPDNPNEIAHRCRKIFTDNYNVLVDAKTVYTFIDPSSIEFQEYEESANRISSVLRNIIYLKRVKVLDWHNYEINLKEFEMLYREGGKDNTEIHDLMKLRKLMLTDLIETINSLISVLNNGLKARSRFLRRISLPDISHSSLEGIKNTVICLRNITKRISTLKKSPFVRGEWLTRIQRQVEIAQSYSATPQYDQVNLLHIKLYFAHFKQETIIQERSYNMFLLLAEIGGTIGLYVGASLLTVAETIVFFFEKRTTNAIIKPVYI